MELYILLAEERYMEVWNAVKKKISSSSCSFEDLDCAFVAAYYLFPDKVHEIGKKIVQRCEDENFLRRLRHYHSRVAENLDNIEEKREICFYHPCHEEWGPENIKMKEGLELFIFTLASNLSQSYKVTIYSNPCALSKFRLSCSNPQYKPLDKFTQDKHTTVISTEKKELACERLLFLSLEEEGFLFSDKDGQRRLLLGRIGKKGKNVCKNLTSCVYYFPNTQHLQACVQDFLSASKSNNKLSLHIYTMWKDNKEVEDFISKHKQHPIQVKDYDGAEQQLSKYSFWLGPEKGLYYANALSKGCICSSNLSQTLKEVQAYSSDEIKSLRKNLAFVSWREAVDKVKKII